MIATLEPQVSTPAPRVPTFDVPILRAALAQLRAEQPDQASRLDRAAAIVAVRTIERWGPGYLVESEREAGRYYLVSRDAFGVRCLCADYQRRKLDCKHILAVRLLARCEQLAAPPPIPLPLPELDPDAPIPFALTPLAERALAASRA